MMASSSDAVGDVVDVVIAGRGIAALQLHRALRAACPTWTVRVVGPDTQDEGACGLPEAIVHPFPGRSFNVPDEQWEAMRHLQSFLDDMHARCPTLVRKSAMVRPLVPAVRERLLSSWEQAQDRLRDADIAVDKISLPSSFSVTEGLRYGGGAQLRLAELLQTYFADVDTVDARVDSATAAPASVQVDLDNGRRLRCRHMVWATGSAARVLLHDDVVDVDRGALLLAQREQPLDLELGWPMWSAGVHLAQGLQQYTVGSTHFAGADDVDVDAVADALLRKAERVMPEHGLTTSSAYWGERLVVRDRRPVVGDLDDNVFILAGFGGTGVLWSAACAHWLVRLLLDGTRPPALVDVRRLRRFH